MAKSQKTQAPKSQVATNTFGTLGYLSVLVQWLWALLIICYPIIMERPGFLFPTGESTPMEPIQIGSEFTPISIIFAAIVTVVVLITVVIVVIRVPKSFGKKAGKLTHQTAQKITPRLLATRKLKKSERKQLSFRVTIGIKALLVIIPILALLFVEPPVEISTNATLVFALFCGTMSVFYFAVQFALGKIYSVDSDEIW